MTTIKLNGINIVRKKLAGGKEATYFYHRATGIRLRGEPGTAQFLEDFREADGTIQRDGNTVRMLITEFQKSPQWSVAKGTAQGRNRSKKRGIKPLSDGTKREYRRMLGYLDEEFGAMTITALGAKGAIGVFIDYQEEIAMESPREADNRLTVMSAVFSYAFRKGKIVRNPLLGFERMYDSDRADIIWLEPDITEFMEKAPIELQRALILAIHTGQRYGDLIRLRWSDYDGEYIQLKQKKTSVKVKVKVSSALKRMLDKMTKVGPYILTRPDGRPWFTGKDDKRMGKKWGDHFKTTKLSVAGYLAEAHKEPDLAGEKLHFNDLRGTAVTLLAESGCTEAEIACITGHSPESAGRILKKYLARTKSLSDAAILKFENAQATTFANRLQTREAS